MANPTASGVLLRETVEDAASRQQATERCPLVCMVDGQFRSVIPADVPLLGNLAVTKFAEFFPWDAALKRFAGSTAEREFQPPVSLCLTAEHLIFVGHNAMRQESQARRAGRVVRRSNSWSPLTFLAETAIQSAVGNRGSAGRELGSNRQLVGDLTLLLLRLPLDAIIDAGIERDAGQFRLEINSRRRREGENSMVVLHKFWLGINDPVLAVAEFQKLVHVVASARLNRTSPLFVADREMNATILATSWDSAQMTDFFFVRFGGYADVIIQ